MWNVHEWTKEVYVVVRLLAVSDDVVWIVDDFRHEIAADVAVCIDSGYGCEYHVAVHRVIVCGCEVESELEQRLLGIPHDVFHGAEEAMAASIWIRPRMEHDELIHGLVLRHLVGQSPEAILAEQIVLLQDDIRVVQERIHRCVRCTGTSARSEYLIWGYDIKCVWSFIRVCDSVLYL